MLLITDVNRDCVAGNAAFHRLVNLTNAPVTLRVQEIKRMQM
jgi:hypothetical protein